MNREALEDDHVTIRDNQALINALRRRTFVSLKSGESEDDWLCQQAAQALAALTARNAALEEAAKSLANTADGLRMEEDLIRQAIGNTNWECLRQRIESVRALTDSGKEVGDAK